MLILSDILHDMHWIVVVAGCLLCIAAALGSRKQNAVLLVLYLAFVQLGAILYRLWPRGYVVLIPSLLSLAIEVMQLVLRTGLFELDDIVSNSLGGLIGVLVCWGIRKGIAALST